MKQLEVPTMIAEVIDGVVTTFDRVYTFDRLRELCACGPAGVRRVRAHLFGPGRDRPAVAEATVWLENGSTIPASGEGTTMRDAVDQLATSLARRLHGCTRGSTPTRSQTLPWA